MWPETQGLIVHKHTFNQVPVPGDAWTVAETKSAIKTHRECVNMAHRSQKYALTYNRNSQICQIGTADFSKVDNGNGNENVQVTIKGSHLLN